MAYDNIRAPKTDSDETPKCEHEFIDGELITEYSDDICEKLIQHGKDGYFIEGFFGRYNICIDSIMKWINDNNNEKYNKLRSALKISMSATIFYFNQELIHALDNFELLGQSIPVLRQILADIMKATPSGLRELQFDALKASETAEERRIRLENESKMHLSNAFRGINE